MRAFPAWRIAARRSRTLPLALAWLALALVAALGAIGWLAGAGRAIGVPGPQGSWPSDVGPVVAPTGYVRMSDGTLIAVNVRLPDHYRPGKRYPSVFYYEGYEGASGRPADRGAGSPWYDVAHQNQYLNTQSLNRGVDQAYNPDFVTVHASIRGTGCSGGAFQLFSHQSDLDGKAVINWMARQPWSDGKVGIVGHSYSGIEGLRVAATRPKPLVAVMVGGITDDFYRGLVYQGGIYNDVFPEEWVGEGRPVADLSGRYGGILETDKTCAANQAQHNDLNIATTLAQMTANTTDDPYWHDLSLYPLMQQITAPVHITQGWQDDATGPRGAIHLWQLITNAPKRLLMMNDDHHIGGYRPLPQERDADQLRWFNYWLGRGTRSDARLFGTLVQRRSSVSTIYEMQAIDSSNYQLHSTGERQETSSWPIPSTQWTDLYLHEGGALSLQPPVHSELPDSYISGTQSYFDGSQHDYLTLGPAGNVYSLMVPTVDGPDVVSYRTAPFARTGLINGPMVLSLWATSTTRDSDFYTLLADEAPNGDRTYLQYGMLRASYRATDPALGDAFTDRSGRRVVYRPYHPYTAASAMPLTAGVPYQLDIEVYPVGDIVRPGHRLLLQVTSPPVFTNIYGYQPNPAGPGTDQILHDPTHPSRLTVPFIALDGMHVAATAPACGRLSGAICISGASPAYNPSSGPQFDPPQGLDAPSGGG